VSHGAKPFSSDYVEETVRCTIQSSAVDQLAAVATEQPRLDYQLGYAPIAPGSLGVIVKLGQVSTDNGRGDMLVGHALCVGKIDYRTGVLSLDRDYCDGQPLEVRFNYRPGE
jgi:hypothetical protein